MRQIANGEFLTRNYDRSSIGEKKFTHFLNELKNYLNRYPKIQNEEEGKPYLTNLLLASGFENFSDYTIAPEKKIDLAVFKERTNGSREIEVIIETKINKSEMISDDNFHKKSFAQICYYYSKYKSSTIKHLIITNYQTIYIFKASEIEKITSSSNFPQCGEDAKTESIYSDILKNLDDKDIENLKYTKIDFSNFSIDEVEELVKDVFTKDKKMVKLKEKLIAIYKLLSPITLLGLSSQDKNLLDNKFYFELLYIFGLKEVEEQGIKKIERLEEEEREEGSILELTLFEMGERENFEDGFELVIIWLNRILFLKLLEARLISMHPSFKPFMNFATISNFRQLDNLFFEVMAKEKEERKRGLEIFKDIPYMNSSLFEKKEIEDRYFSIRELDCNIEMNIYQNTNLKEETRGRMKTLEYLFNFLDGYDFGSNGEDKVVPVEKKLISSSVLGLVFEKINGYRDGSHFTPSFITAKLARDAISRYSGDLRNIKVLDPAVGSGHILVSVLNELVYRRAEILDEFGEKRKIVIEDDEVFISGNVGYVQDEKGKFPSEAIRIQKYMFNLVKEIIENNLFGVDINSKSVEITRLRLWIELLK
ncbi:MAG TPA: hypothetical protein EYG60_03650, partial [Campylobacterales bacterium]|nr:hypothetical protein [Campylobacterales bacterium]